MKLLTLICSFLCLSFAAQVHAAQEDDQAQELRRMNGYIFDGFVGNISRLRLGTKAQPLLNQVSEAPLANEALLELVGRQDLALDIRAAAAMSIQKTLLDSDIFISKIFQQIEDPELPDKIRQPLLYAIASFATINSVNETEDRAVLITNHIARVENPSLLIAYMSVLSGTGIPDQLILPLLQSFFRHSHLDVRAAAANAYPRFHGYRDEVAVVAMVEEELQLQESPAVRVALVKILDGLRKIKPLTLLSRLALRDPSAEVRAQAHLTQLTLRGWYDPATRRQAFLGGSPWSERWFAQDRRNLSARLKTWLHEKTTRCERTL